jgi:hypothetical protein
MAICILSTPPKANCTIAEAVNIIGYIDVNWSFSRVRKLLTISNPDLLSKCKIRFEPGIGRKKSTYIDRAQCQKAIGDGIYLTKKKRAETVQRDFSALITNRLA